MQNLKTKIVNTLYILLIAMILWIVISTMIQAFKCTELTQTELLLHIPKSFICVWEYCH